MAEIDDWNVSASSNNLAPPNGWPENMQYSAVNNVGRENMAVIARWYQDTNGSLTATGTADAQALAPNRTISALARGQEFAFRPVANNTGACTLQIDALAAADVKMPSGEDPPAGALDTGSIAKVIYDGTNFVLVSGIAAQTLNSLTVTDSATFSGATIADLGTVTTADLDGGTIDDMTIGATTPSTGAFTDIDAHAADLASSTSLSTSSVTTVQLAGGSQLDGTYYIQADGTNINHKIKATVLTQQFGNATITIEENEYLNTTALENLRVVGDAGGDNRYLVVDTALTNALTITVGAVGKNTNLNVKATPDGSTAVSNAYPSVASSDGSLRNSGATNLYGLRGFVTGLADAFVGSTRATGIANAAGTSLSIGQRFAGIVVASSVDAGNASTRTSGHYWVSVFEGNATVITALEFSNGSNPSTFTVSYDNPSGAFVVTNTSGATRTLSIAAFGMQTL